MSIKRQWILAVLLQCWIPLHAQAATPVWSIDPASPGSNVPAVGASYFDLITAETTAAEMRQHVPFPFERLVARIEAAAGCSERHSCTRSVLLPLGRSLQRAAASPDFFAHPRVVTAVVSDGRGPYMLRDRLYLGYQAKADVIEVISYNEALGRFEFQIVSNYRAGQTPRVAYASRSVCVSCHQNHGPIFSRQVWLETNANPEVAARLERQQKQFHGVTARGSTDIANAIDDATDRANRLSVAQQLWRYGCGEREAGDRCRRAALTAALQFGLTGGRAYDVTDESFQRDVVAMLGRNAQSLWPAGMAVPNPDIVNRNPLSAPASLTGLMLAHVPAQFDPLSPRAPLEVLAPDGAGLADELVKGIAGFWSDHGVAELDRLLQRSAAARSDGVELQTACNVTAAAKHITFECSEGSAARLAGTLRDTEGTLDALSIGASSPVRHLQAGSIEKRRDANGHSAWFVPRDRTRAARLPDGNAIERITLRWPLSTDGGSRKGSATITIRKDFTAVAAAMPVPSGPISSAGIEAVAARLGGASGTRPVETVRAVSDSMPRETAVPATSVFEPECGSCHHTTEITPPNFLTGGAKRVTAAIASCAPRILVRLGMHDVPAQRRDKTPMPPEIAVLPGQTAAARSRTSSASLAAVRRTVEEQLRQEYGRVPTVAELLEHGYESLRPCLP